jgi:hypothetical protein
MSPGCPEAWDRDLPAGEDELWEAVADPSRRKVLDLILAHGQASHDIPFLRGSVSRDQYRKSKP